MKRPDMTYLQIDQPMELSGGGYCIVPLDLAVVAVKKQFAVN